MKDNFKIFKSKLKKFWSKYKKIVGFGVVFFIILLLACFPYHIKEKYKNDTSISETSKFSLVKRANTSSDEYNEGYNKGYNLCLIECTW